MLLLPNVILSEIPSNEILNRKRQQKIYVIYERFTCSDALDLVLWIHTWNSGRQLDLL